MAEKGGSPRNVAIGDFLGEPTRELARWRWLWAEDRPFPIRSHRGPLGRLLVAFKRLLRPLVRVPQNDLWERQRVFNLILLEHLQQLDDLKLESRVGHLENALPERLREVVAHNDALFARLDQKLDLYRRQAADLGESLGAALAVAETAAGSTAAGSTAADSADTGEAESAATSAELVRARDEQGYLELERRFRGTEEEIGQRLERYLPYLEGRGGVLDLGCGRGESLALLGERGIAAHGIDSSASMVEHCRSRGLTAHRADLFEHLAALEPGELGAVVSFHVVEHLPPEALDRLVRLAWRALRPGGVLILETPNPLSLVVAARNFWLDPTHRRPVHPDSLQLSCRLAGFDPVEKLDLRPFPAALRLPEVDLESLPAAQRELADRVNRLRDQLDELLYGYQDFAVVAEKPAAAAPAASPPASPPG